MTLTFVQSLLTSTEGEKPLAPSLPQPPVSCFQATCYVYCNEPCVVRFIGRFIFSAVLPSQISGTSELIATAWNRCESISLLHRALRFHSGISQRPNGDFQEYLIVSLQVPRFVTAMPAIRPLLQGTMKHVQETASTIDPRNVCRRGFLRNVLVVMSGTATAQLIAFAFSPFLSRLYDPTAFGVLGTYSSVAGVLPAAATLNFADAIVIPKEDRKAVALLLISLSSTAIITLTTVACCVTAPKLCLNLIGLEQSGHVLWLLPLSVLLLGTGQSLTAWCTRLRAFRLSAKSGVVRSITGCLTQATGGILGLAAIGLVGGTVVAEACAVMLLGLA